MKKILRSIGLTAAVVGSVGLGTTPANAGPGAGGFFGEASINCFGCGASTGTATLCFAGYVAPQGAITDCADPEEVRDWVEEAIDTRSVPEPLPTIYRNVTASYTVFQPAGATCVVQGTASGSTTGAVAVSFNWTRVGNVAVISTTGDINGSGVAVFKVTSPVGLPCGGPVEAQVVGAIAGT